MKIIKYHASPGWASDGVDILAEIDGERELLRCGSIRKKDIPRHIFEDMCKRLSIGEAEPTNIPVVDEDSDEPAATAPDNL